MNFSVHFDEATIDRLAAAVERSGLTRNRIIVQAVRDWLERNEEPGWPVDLQAHFRNPAPELREDVVDVQAWTEALGREPELRW